MSENVLSVKDLTVTYGKKERKTYAVQGVSLSVDSGRTLGIVGESGCGKTTVALALMGLLDARTTVTGTMALAGNEYDLSTMTYKKWRSIRGDDLSMVFQDSLASLNPLKRIGEQIAEAIYVKRTMSKKAARTRSVELLELVEIPDAARRARQYPHECSGGMRQRAMIAMALSNNPKLLICDEPTTALDVTVQAQILHTIKRLQTELGMAVVLVTHDLGVINAVSDNVSVMYASKIVESGTTDEILRHAAHPYTHALLRAMPDISTEKEELYSIPGVPPTLNREFEWCPFGPRCEYHTKECDEQMPALINVNKLDSIRECACIYPLQETVGRL